MTSLFRRQAVDHQRKRLWGEVLILQPVKFHYFTFGLVAALVAAAVFLATGSYARKETVQGYLVPDQGLSKLYPARGGTVIAVHAAQGATVEKGTPIVTLRLENGLPDGAGATARLLEQLDRQLAELDTQIANAALRADAEERRLTTRKEGLQAERAALAERRGVQARALAVAEEQMTRLETILAQGYVSQVEYKAREQAMLTEMLNARGLDQQAAALDTQIGDLESQLRQLPVDHKDRMAELNSRRAALLQQRTEIERGDGYVLYAPVSGRIATLQAAPGQSTTPQIPVATILPEGSTLKAHLFVPTRAVGFVEAGDPVRLMYQAFPFQRYGVHEGTVDSTSGTILTPAELTAPVQLQEPVYRVTAALERQTVAAFGKDLPLQPGMLLEADIILDRRNLADWLLEPLRSVGQK